ncbi:sensor histidine kinase, partial [Hydrogenophaga sp.]
VQARTTELSAALAALQQVDQRRRQLFADVSHELRTPATAIRGEAQVALRGRDKPIEEYKDSLRRVADTAAQLGQVIDDLLVVAREDIDALAVRREPIDLRDPIAAALEQARGLAGSQQVRVESAPPPVHAMPVLGDAPRLQQLLAVLLDNAVRYSRPGGMVRLQVEPLQPQDQPPQWDLRVEDRGI